MSNVDKNVSSPSQLHSFAEDGKKSTRCIQLFRERLSEKAHGSIPKCIVGSFKFTSTWLQRSQEI